MRTWARTIGIVGLAAVTGFGMAACDDDDNPVDTGGNTPPPGNQSRVVVMAGDITGNRTLNADSVYVINGFVEVQPGGTLTVPAGTRLISDINSNGTIVTLRGNANGPSGRLVVQGTAGAPVVFQPGTAETAEQLALRPAQALSCSRGQGGGIVLHGNAPVNPPGTPISEGVARPFGGDDPTDSSGDIQYLVIACGGTKITPDNEVNGLTFAGTGSGTRISHVQTHLIADDGFEWFGGTTSADHIVSSGNDDDAFDCDFGWQGGVQFGVAVQDADLANRGMECDNDGDGSGNTPITMPNMWNMTWIGAGVLSANSDVNDGLYLRRNSAPTIRNSIVANFGNAGVAIDGSGSQAQATAGNLVLNNMLFFQNKLLAGNTGAMSGSGTCAGSNIGFRTSGVYTPAAPFAGNTFVCADPQLGSVNYADPINGQMPNLVPAAGSPALNAANAASPTGPGVVDGSANYLGAFSSNNWMSGWTVWNAPTS